jgi:hypothetical protein
MRYAKFNEEGILICLSNLGNPSDGFVRVPDDITKNELRLIDGNIVELSDEEIENEFKALQLVKLAKQIRNKRNLLLVEADKLTQMDIWETYDAKKKKKISAYKQALRDIPTQKGFPEDVVYPTLE